MACFGERAAQSYPAGPTTLEVFNLQHAIDDFAKQGVQALAIEASSHGLHQQRLQGVPCQCGDIYQFKS